LAHVGPGHIQQLIDDRKKCSLELTWHTMTLSPPLVAVVGQSETISLFAFVAPYPFFSMLGRPPSPVKDFDSTLHL
jgi:hypothetical protein